METRITVTGGTLDKQEIQNYVTHLREEHPGRNFETIDIKVDGEYVVL